MVVFSKRLTTAGGRRAGSLHAVCTVTQPHRSIETATFQCDGTYVLRGGQLAIAAAARIGSARTLTLAVTGGTGVYSGARGVVVSRESGETATDTFRLTR
jgi:hypothetical protein